MITQSPFYFRDMLSNTDKSAELIVMTMFKINALKRTLCTRNNLFIRNYLECYDHLFQMLDQAVKMTKDELFIQKITKAISYTNKLIEHADNADHQLDNTCEANEILKDIRQHLQLIESREINERDWNSYDKNS